ncbi:hypothetical protein Pan181_23300 [Aeoliella mucimassa]|uniref:Uncharacterized protein n=1 Tax=Aeoliella mucimassa TaxID=2527972 RepID=A0A518AN48_9BACT|nr:hypothetical protein Pan181_23300 [Aeoliella mucimassa]
MQLVTGKRLAVLSHCENRFPLDAFWEMGIYSQPKTTGFVEPAEIQFSHRWENWESIPVAREIAGFVLILESAGSSWCFERPAG